MKVAINTKNQKKSMIFQHVEDDSDAFVLDQHPGIYFLSISSVVIGLYELLGNPTTYLIEPPGP
jgi:hypothetical protein